MRGQMRASRSSLWQRMQKEEQYAATSQVGSSLAFIAAIAGRQCYIQDASGRGLWSTKVCNWSRVLEWLMKENERGWKGMKLDERWWTRMKEDIGRLKIRKEDERGWKIMKEYERGWKRTKEDKRGQNKIKEVDRGWKRGKYNEIGGKRIKEDKH